MKSCLDYHRETSYRREEQKGHLMDWQNQPRLFKSYPEDLETIPLVPTQTFERSSLWQLPGGTPATLPLDLNTLSTLLDLTQTFTARARQPSGDFYFRSAASAGALYPNEIYVGVHHMADVDSGVYYYDVFQRGLVTLRKENTWPFLKDMLHQTAPGHASATFFVSAIFNRSSWKYRERAYRYVLLDAGHVLQNLFFALNSLNMGFSFGYDFVDQAVNTLLGLDDQKEVCLAWVNISGNTPPVGQQKPLRLPGLPESILSAGQTAQVETGYPLILDIHRSGHIESLNTIPEPAPFPNPMTVGPLPNVVQKIRRPDNIPHARTYPDALFMRRSKRNFVPQALSFETVNHLLALVDAQSTLDAKAAGPYPQSLAVGFLADHVAGMDSGFYLCDFSRNTFGRVEDGVFQTLMAPICLEQTWLKNAGLHFLFMADLKEIDRRWGARGYRYAMMEAGRLGQALYVGATALGLGCCGIGALFDFEARKLLDLNDTSFLLYLVAVGQIKS